MNSDPVQSGEGAGRGNPWRQNLYIVVCTQFIIMLGFAFVNPFIALYAQDLGGLSNESAALWGGISSAAMPAAMFLTAPIWGVLADRWGRKLMLLRAMFGAGIAVILTGFATNIYQLVGLRFIQGIFGGTVPAAQALIVSSAPRNKVPYAMGLIALSMFVGNTAGPLIGGLMADTLGFRNSFFITGAVTLFDGLLAVFLIKEGPRLSPAGKESASLGGMLRLAGSRELLPLLLAIFALQIAPQMISPILPIYMKELDPTVRAATISGLAFALTGGLAGISSAVSGRIGEKVGVGRILAVCCMSAGILYLPPVWAQTAMQLVIMVAATGLIKGGIMSSSSALVGLSVSTARQGAAYGLSQSASSLGNSLGPLLGGGLVPLIGFRPVFAVAAALFMVVGFVVIRLVGSRAPVAKKEPAEP